MAGGCYLGIDLGTTTFKGAILDIDAVAIRGVRRVPSPAPVPGRLATRHELDPDAVLRRVRELIHELVRDSPQATGLVLCGQMHGVVLVDHEGRPRSNIITWKDERALERSSGGKLLEALRRQITAEELSEIGGELRPGVPIVTLAALRDEGRLSDGLLAASLCDFVLAQLADSSCREPCTDPTNAAAHGLYHLDCNDWHGSLIERLGLGSLRWPRIQTFAEVVGELEIQGKRLRCFTPVGDQQCALAGTALADRELSLNISTGSQVSLIGKVRPKGEFLARPYFDGRWLRTIVSVPAGRSLQLLANLVSELAHREKDPWAFIRAAVEMVEETDLEVDLSFFAGWTGERGRIGNIHEGNLSVGHLFAAAFRSMAANYASCAAVLSPERAWDRVVFSGGLTLAFPRLRRDILTALGDPASRAAGGEEETLRGLLALALVCDGRAGTVEEAGRMLPRSV